MHETLSLGISLFVAVGLSVGASLWIRFRFADIIHDEAGLRLLIGDTWPHIPPRFLTVVFTGTALVLSWLAGFSFPSVVGIELGIVFPLASMSLFAGATGWLFWIDSSIHRLPDRLVLPLGAGMFGITALGLVFGYFEVARSAQIAGIRGLLGSFIVVIVFLFINLVVRLFGSESIGMGDVKLGALIGLVVGTISLWGLLIMFLVANASACVYYVNTRYIKHRRVRYIAFGPHLLIGTWTAVILAPLAL